MYKDPAISDIIGSLSRKSVKGFIKGSENAGKDGCKKSNELTSIFLYLLFLSKLFILHLKKLVSWMWIWY